MLLCCFKKREQFFQLVIIDRSVFKIISIFLKFNIHVHISHYFKHKFDIHVHMSHYFKHKFDIHVHMSHYFKHKFDIHVHMSHYFKHKFDIHIHMLHYFKHKFNPSQHGFSKTKSTLVPCLDFIPPLTISQRQVDSIYFNFSSTSDLVSCTVLLTKLLFSDGYLNWFGIYFLMGKIPYAF
jgi:hypothetical protein